VLPDNFLVIGDTPHDWLFPRTAAVIHHGGSGTSHSAARAGVPSIVIPFAGDQFFWAERLRVAGVAPATVDGRWPRAEAVVSALDFAADDRVRKHARVLGETMRSENGVWMQWRPLNASCGLDAQYAGRTADRNS
jgi:sterol 3beta-glucosyltransferase